MEREQVLEVVKEYESIEGGGSLIIDMDEQTVECTPDSNAINHGPFLVVHSRVTNEKCECGEYYNDECETCVNYAELLAGIVEHKLAQKLTLGEFLELASDVIETKLDKDMVELGQYANASHILNGREKYKNLLTDIFDNADYIMKDAAQEIIHDALFPDY